MWAVSDCVAGIVWRLLLLFSLGFELGAYVIFFIVLFVDNICILILKKKTFNLVLAYVKNVNFTKLSLVKQINMPINLKSIDFWKLG